jgi:hypothetical protein
MGGKHLPTPAWLVFFAAVDELCCCGAGRPEVWAFLREQCLACIKSTRDFSDVGEKVPLLDAMVRRAQTVYVWMLVCQAFLIACQLHVCVHVCVCMCLYVCCV